MFITTVGQHQVEFRDSFRLTVEEELTNQLGKIRIILNHLYGHNNVIKVTSGSGVNTMRGEKYVFITVYTTPITSEAEADDFNKLLTTVDGISFSQPNKYLLKGTPSMTIPDESIYDKLCESSTGFNMPVFELAYRCEPCTDMAEVERLYSNPPNNWACELRDTGWTAYSKGGQWHQEFTGKEALPEISLHDINERLMRIEKLLLMYITQNPLESE